MRQRIARDAASSMFTDADPDSREASWRQWQQTGPSGEWHLMRGGTPPDRVGEPVTAVVLRRIERRDDD